MLHYQQLKFIITDCCQESYWKDIGQEEVVRVDIGQEEVARVDIGQEEVAREDI